MSIYYKVGQIKVFPECNLPFILAPQQLSFAQQISLLYQIDMIEVSFFCPFVFLYIYPCYVCLLSSSFLIYPLLRSY